MTDQPDNAPPPPLTAPASPSHGVPRSLESIVGFATEYPNKKFTRAEVAAFMADLLAWLHAPPTLSAPSPEDAQRAVDALKSIPASAPMLVDDAPTVVTRALAQLEIGIEPVVRSRAVYLPPHANRMYTPREARALAAKLCVQADVIDNVV
jgi:hypothetical protein